MANEKSIPPVTKEEFLEAWAKHPPNGWTRFAYRYFSRGTKKEDRWLSTCVFAVLIVFFLLGFFGTVLKPDVELVKYSTLALTAVLVLLFVLRMPAAVMNNLLVRRVRKELGLTLSEYERYASMYL